MRTLRVLTTPLAATAAVVSLAVAGLTAGAQADQSGYRRAAEQPAARSRQRELRPAALLADEPGAVLRHARQPAGPRLGRLPGPGRAGLAAVRRREPGPEEPPRQDRAAAEGHLVRPLAARLRHPGPGQQVHRADDRWRPRGARPDVDLPDGPVGARGVQPPPLGGRAGVVQEVDRRLRGRRRRRPHGRDHAAGRPVRALRARRLEAAGEPDQVRRAASSARCPTRACTSTPVPRTGTATTRRRRSGCWCRWASAGPAGSR